MFSNSAGSVSRPWVCEVELEQRIVGHRLRADPADRRLDVLRLERGDDVGRRQLEARQPVDVEHDPHRIVLGAEERRVADARNALERVEHVDRRVVREEQVVELPSRR